MYLINLIIASIQPYIYSIGLRGYKNQFGENAAYLNGTFEIQPKNLNSPVLTQFLSNESTIAPLSLLDLWAVDYPKRLDNQRFQINYLFLSLLHNLRIRQFFYTSYLQSVPSLTKFYPNANWLEREVWDLFGVFFADHPDLRKILTDYGFEGNPLRKDFPLTGYLQVRYDDEKKRILYESLNLNQEFRVFSFNQKNYYK